MKKTLIAAAVLAVLALSGCATPTFESLTPAPALSTDDGYVSAVRAAAPTLAETEADTLIDSGKGVCSQLVLERSPDELFAKAVAAGLSPAEGEAIISSAIAAYCPEQVWLSQP
jgi:hypothetical protein